MTTIDVVIIGLLIVTAITGYRRGFLRQLGMVVGVVAGILACRLLSADFAHWLEARDFFKAVMSGAPELVVRHAAGVISSTMIFVAAYIAVHLVVGMMRGIVHGMALGFIDNCMGMITSVFVGFLVLSIILNVCQVFKQGGSVIDKSTLGGGRVAEAVLDLAPQTFGVATAVFGHYFPTSEP